MGSEKKSICALEVGQEEAAARALGGAFVLEDCGPLAECRHKVESFDFSSGKEDYVEIFYCATNYVYVGLIIAAVLLVVFFLYRKVRKTRQYVPDLDMN
jgi:hypothetical protein